MFELPNKRYKNVFNKLVACEQILENKSCRQLEFDIPFKNIHSLGG